MHLASRRVLLAACTANLDEAWMPSDASTSLAWTLEEEGIKLKGVIHDRDKKFSPRADNVFRSVGARVILTPLMAPRANAHAERWIGSCRRECIDRMLVVNQRHLEAILREYCMHYNQERPHRSRELRPPSARGDPAVARTRGVRRRVRLGGLISEYYQEAVAA
ncbi:MAG TPA: integrase [Chloroflexi bacterium]|nr:integrase [Chloroflexota bacterium]